eukprot:TRINITY_DN7099_c0_g1_i1.p1 TRINITY_DN7099_c0_g1~~TRINITY_DN7099_c0_g1_i1.p1  ORF type:complete len:638 (-),score=76.14 TRINITY_DN7099_c0_g1_i1:13-1926(-)
MNQGFTRASNFGGPGGNPPAVPPQRGPLVFDTSASKRRKLNDGINTLSLKRLDTIVEVSVANTIKEAIFCVLAKPPPEARQSEGGASKQFFQTITVADETRESLEIRLWSFPERAANELLPATLPAGTPLKIVGLKLEPYQKPTVRIGAASKVSWFPNGRIPGDELPILKARIVELNEWWAATKAPAVAQQPMLADLVEMDRPQFELALRFLICQWIGVEMGPPTETGKRIVVCDGSHRPQDSREFTCTIRIYTEYSHLFPEENIGRWMHIGPVVPGSSTPLSCAGGNQTRRFNVAFLRDDEPEVLDRLEMRRKLASPHPQIVAPFAPPGVGNEFSGPFKYAGASSVDPATTAAPHHPPAPFPIPQPQHPPALSNTGVSAPWRSVQQQQVPSRGSSDPDPRPALSRQPSASRSASDLDLHGRGQHQQQPIKKRPTLLEEFDNPNARVVTRMLPKYSSLPLTSLNTVWSIINKAQQQAGPVYRVSCKVLSLFPQRAEDACRQLCRNCRSILPVSEEAHQFCPACGGNRLEWWYYVMMCVYGREVPDAANVLIAGPSAVQFFNGIPACNLRTAPTQVLETLARKLTLLSEKDSVLDIGVEIDEMIDRPELGFAFPKVLLSGCLFEEPLQPPESRTLVSL